MSATWTSERPVHVGDAVRTTIAELNFLRWNTQVGKVIAEYVRNLTDESDDRWSANMVLCSSDLVDWAAAEYAVAEKSATPTLPTEVLNADGCRVFGRVTKLGWAGAALVLADDCSTAETVLRALSTITCNSLCIFAIVTRCPTTGWDITVRSFRHAT